MPTDDSSAMVLADPAPTTEQNRRNKKKLVWRKRSEISQTDTLVVTPRELPVLAPVKNLQLQVAVVMHDQFYQDPSTETRWIQPPYTPLCLEEGMKLEDIVALALCNFETAGKYKD
jgi:hypothetical protein